jgi:DNA-binding CsgD family transcriptional regulator
VTRPTVRLFDGVPPAGWGPLEPLPAEPHDQHGQTRAGTVTDERSAAAALDTALRGGALHLYVLLDGPARDTFLDQLVRIAQMEQGGGDGLADEEAVLLGLLRAGAQLEEAARGAGMSRRTAARRLDALRRRYGVQTVAELVVVTRR